MEGIQDEQCEAPWPRIWNWNLDPHPSPRQAATLMKNLYAMLIGCDCTQVEVNPIAETPDGEVVVCDAKLQFDSNAEYY
jgi:succinyl-CoA synthetase beta subunit